eukprot:gb/GECG01003513.1/.p1 GENE.gb/GECG01003513.1/~~gb/GECG01003513.1/.p1  ORF type:complete len:365 (+),score=61.96 gb/GECG01003513.1/:1-1095(+)
MSSSEVNGDADGVYEKVQEYYGKTLTSTKDLATDACCVLGEESKQIRKLLKNVHPEVTDRFYGCGSPVPPLLEGKTVLDLGCGTGRDCFLASQLVGEKGKVIGIDMTPEQLEVARKYEEWHREKFGFAQKNTLFLDGHIENIPAAGIEDSSIDVVISNCVVNLASDKRKVIQQVWKILKEGGELYFSDVYSDRRIPDAAKRDTMLYGECLSGALYTNDFRRLMKNAGFNDYRAVTNREIKLNLSSEAMRKLGHARFYSQTIRAFKISDLEDGPEDYGQETVYVGSDNEFTFGLGQVFPRGISKKIDKNTALMLQNSRYEEEFEVKEPGKHLGAFGLGEKERLAFGCFPSQDWSKNVETGKGSCC